MSVVFGSFLRMIKDKFGAEIWGVEPFESVAQKAKELTPNIIIAAIEDAILTLPKEKFDSISFNDVLEHLLNPGEILKNTKPLLAKKGVVIASIPNIFYLPVFIGEIFWKQDWKYEDSGILDNTHIRFFTKKSIIRLFDEAGYTIKQIKGINGIDGRKNLKFKILNALTFGNFSDMQYLQFAVVAEPK